MAMSIVRPQVIDIRRRTRHGSGMRWDEGLFDDLEQQAEGLALAARDAEVAEQTRAEYARVDLDSRLHGSRGARLLLEVAGVGRVDGVLARAGAGWCLLDDGRHDWLVVVSAIGSLRGLAERGIPAAVRPVTARLGLASALRGVAEARGEVLVHRADGSTVRGGVGRVGADFLEVLVGEPRAGYAETVPLAAVTAVRSL